jgi:membrane fusion protein (multidrug efflux system)
MSVLRQLFILIVGGAAVTGAWLWYAEDILTAGKPTATPSAAPLPIEVARVVERPVRSIVEAVGTTRAAQSIDVVTTVSGRIAKIHFEAGQRINQGDFLISLDDAPERAAVAEAKALVEEARLNFERGQQLALKQTMAQAQIDELRAQHLVAKARLDNAASRLSDREVRAPFAGVVGLRNVSLGAWVDDETVITTLDALSPLEIEFSVPEVFFSEIGPGTPVLAASDAFPDRDIRGSVETVDSRIDPVTRSFRVRAEIDNPGSLLPASCLDRDNPPPAACRAARAGIRRWSPRAGRASSFASRTTWRGALRSASASAYSARSRSSRVSPKATWWRRPGCSACAMARRSRLGRRARAPPATERRHPKDAPWCCRTSRSSGRSSRPS